MPVMRSRLALAGALAAAAGALAGYFIHGALSPEAHEAQAAPVADQPRTMELRFAEGAPQLDFIRTEAVAAHPEPLLDPLNARVVYDENYTQRVATPIAGRVARILAQPGDRVGAGQALLEIDAPEYAQAEAEAQKASADLRQKQAAYRRSRELVEAEVAARKDLESAQAELSQSEAEQRRARARLANLTQGGRPSPHFTLRSRMGGVVAERRVNPGGEVRPETPDPLFVVTDPAHLWVIVDLPERLLGSVRKGQDVTVEVDAYPGRVFPAVVASVGEVVDPATRRIQVRCVVDNPERLLKPEMYARVTPLAAAGTRLPRVPNSALITGGLYPYVFVERARGTFVKRRVTPGLQGRSETYIRGGIAEGERVVVNGALMLNAELTGS